jgi:hypothetical protein
MMGWRELVFKEILDRKKKAHVGLLKTKMLIA